MSNVEMWYERHLRMRKDQPAVIRLLLWIGFVKFGRKDFTRYDAPEVIIWPFRLAPWHMMVYYWKTDRKVYVFRNLPGVIKWLPGRLLPMRWGFGILGIEFGDRG